MRLNLRTTLFLAYYASVFSLSSCNNDTTGGKLDAVITHELSDPEQLTPFNARDNNASNIFNNTFQTLLSIDYKTYAIVPILATSRPVVKQLPNGKMTLECEIRPEAKWDNGTPITGEDVAFSLKVIRCPQTNNKAYKPYFESIEDIIIDPKNPKKFTLIEKEFYVLAESALYDLWIIPSYIYDEKNILKPYTLANMVKVGAALEADPQMLAFATEYNSSKFQREKVVGSGAYQFTKWDKNQRITLTRKQNWWAEAVAKDKSMYFQAYPKNIIYETINDLTTAIVALKSKRLDCMAMIDPKDFTQELAKSVDFNNDFYMFTPMLPMYSFMGMNTRSPKFSDIRVRKALAHLMDVDQYIQTVTYGLGNRATSFIYPGLDKFKNTDLVPYEFNVNEAKRLLTDAGWADTNNNGTIDKVLDGKPTEFAMDINYNTGNKKREKACLIFQDACQKAGIKVNVVAVDWSILSKNLQSHKFDMFISALGVSSPVEGDPYQLWATSEYNGGSNYCGFGDAASDAVINKIRHEPSLDRRIELTKQLQFMINEACPCIFLSNTKNAIAVSKKYKNVYESNCAPGFFMAGFAGPNAKLVQ